MGNRADQVGEQRTAYQKNRKRILATQQICGICGKPVDFTLEYPHPMSACVDHIIPIKRGGHPSDITNLQLAHWMCNRQKSDKLIREDRMGTNPTDLVKSAISNRDLPLSRDWKTYRG